jgi:protein involved in polysaccharide export with SLBB domain
MMVDLSPVQAGQMQDDLALQPGDQITLLSRYRGMATLRGEVKETGEKPLSGPTQLLDFIRLSGGGFTADADATEIELMRAGQPLQKIDLEEVASGQRASNDPSLEVLPGDVVFVPNDEKKRFSIVGGVRKPGAYPVKPGMTLMDAVFTAEGFTPTASLKQFILAPADPADDRLQALKASVVPAKGSGKKSADPKSALAPSANSLALIDYKKLQTGELNFPLRPGDRILVPEEAPHQPRQSFLDSALRLLPFASLFLVGGGR